MKFENVFKSNCGVYRILNIKTNEFYIGSSKNVVTRFRQHVTSMRGNHSHCSTSEEHKRKISESMKGKTVSFETKQKMSKSRTGIKLSEKTKQKMRNAHKGKKLSENTKLKMSIAHKIKT